ncbi:ABC transporter [Paraconexibacter sp. AEG42_29]|uniref:ABC transporter n=1 Tax=Paraconexibacter sp. AEG42_29 TaxID=2997339 RepID=A0AAU7AVK8_9ACTN
MGPSGAGKTTVLRALAGLRTADAGHVRLGEAVWFDAAARVDLPPEQRSVGLVFQEYALFPHMTVAANVAFARGAAPVPLLERFGIAHLAGAKPAGLSGGERQRVALARALAREPAVLLLDEPLAALDTHTRSAVRDELDELLGGLAIPTVLVTHDFRDAAVLADRVAVIVDGRIRQVGSPAELLADPADAFVASFTGATVVTGHATPDGRGGARIALDQGGWLASDRPASGAVSVAVHPWEVLLDAAPPAGDAPRVTGIAGRVVPEGGRVRVRVGCLIAELPADALAELRAAQPEAALHATVPPQSVRVFPRRQDDLQPEVGLTP